MPYLLIVDQMHDSLPQMLDQAGCTFDYMPAIEAQKVQEQLNRNPYDGLIVRSKIRVTEAFLSGVRAPLKFIARAGAGTDNIELAALQKRKITLLNAPEGNRDAVAEHTIGMLLTLLNHIHTADQEVRQKIWLRQANRGREVKGKTVGIIGFGNTGQAVAQRLQGFGCSIIAYDREPSAAVPKTAQLVSKAELLARADIITLHIPLDEANKNFVDASFLEACKDGIFILNAARGQILDTQALCEALETGKVAGAALDVLENEKLAHLSPQEERWFKYLQNSKRVLLTPHVAGWTHESYRRINEVLVKKITKLFSN